MELKKLSLDTIAGGALPELFQRELDRVLDNIDSAISILSDRIEQLATPAITKTADGAEFWTHQRVPVQPPKPQPLGFCGLRSIVDFVNQSGEVQPGALVVAEDKETVQVFAPLDGFTRPLQAVATRQPCILMLDRWLELEEAIIHLQAAFTDAGDRDTLLSMLARVTADAAVTNEDDGFAQQVSVKAGIALATRATIKNPVTLSPYRTFREVAQPVSQFVVRVRGKEQKQVALFEADGGSWIGDAVEAVKLYLRTAIRPERQVIVL